jgi:hypothetical protein
MTSSSNGQDVAVNTKDQERTQAQPSVFIPLDTSWFDKEPETYLQRDDFREFQEISGNFRHRLTTVCRQGPGNNPKSTI